PFPAFSASSSVSPKYFFRSSPSFDVLGTIFTYAVASSTPAIAAPPSLFRFHTRRKVSVNLRTSRLLASRVLSFRLLRHARTRNRLRPRPTLAALSPRLHLLKIDQVSHQLVTQIPFPIRVQRPIDRTTRVRIRNQVQQIRDKQTGFGIVKIPNPVPHTNQVMIQCSWMLFGEHHE